MLDTYEGREDLSLELLKIYPMKTLALEEKKSSEDTWEAYDPTQMQISLSCWRPGIQSSMDPSLQTKIRVAK